MRVCPYGVFEIAPLADAERRALSFVGRLKAWAHGGSQAFARDAAACHACGLCIAACPEDAILLARVENQE